MANTFSLLLALATLITGTIWCIEHSKWINLFRNVSITGKSKLANSAKFVLTQIQASASIFPVLLLVFLVRSFVYEPFQIPSSSMMPTLLIGDFILVEKYAYGLKNPLNQMTLIKTSHPKRGDIAVFKYPLNPKLDYIKRVIGLPGDRITYNSINKRVSVSPACNGDQYCDQKFAVTYNDAHPSSFIQLFNRSRTSDTDHRSPYQILLSNDTPKNGIRLYDSQESLGNKTHSILSIPGTQDWLISYYHQAGRSLSEWIVPEGYYFMMGDNRDNSADSRYWGFVPEKNLVGKAKFIWMSFEKQEGEWPTGVRLNRIGKIH